uniref:Uncharacterized protein n=1 Tax=Macrostomum lignano TaxID=282301 RepID=A0A1I8FQV8_9PLAT
MFHPQSLQACACNTPVRLRAPPASRPLRSLPLTFRGAKPSGELFH